jgi:hypothetical protein
MRVPSFGAVLIGCQSILPSSPVSGPLKDNFGRLIVAGGCPQREAKPDRVYSLPHPPSRLILGVLVPMMLWTQRNHPFVAGLLARPDASFPISLGRHPDMSGLDRAPPADGAPTATDKVEVLIVMNTGPLLPVSRREGKGG